ncbi:hypothetical protein LC609_30940 [Nostoc sp. XA013]|nr:hypothetical protein [Nostoc sp. XA013]
MKGLPHLTFSQANTSRFGMVMPLSTREWGFKRCRLSVLGGFLRTLTITYSSLPCFNQIPYRRGILPASDTFSSLSETHSRSRGNALSVAMPQALRHVFSTRRTRVRRTLPIHGRYAWAIAYRFHTMGYLLHSCIVDLLD